jgi:hypothetical protein
MPAAVSTSFFIFFSLLFRGVSPLQSLVIYRRRRFRPARLASIAACDGASAVRLVGIPSALRARQT